MYAEYLFRQGIKDNTVQFSLLLLDRDREIGTRYFYKMPGRNLVQSFTEQNVTYGLGYKPIRQSSHSNAPNKNGDTHEDLVRHLGEMDKRTTENRFHLTADVSMCLLITLLYKTR